MPELRLLYGHNDTAGIVTADPDIAKWVDPRVPLGWLVLIVVLVGFVLSLFELLILFPVGIRPALTLRSTKVKETVTQDMLFVWNIKPTRRHCDDNYGFQIHS